MARLASLILRRPRATIAVWGAIIGLVSFQGLGVAHRVAEGDYNLPATESARGAAADQAGWGTNEEIPVLLQGPAVLLDREGPGLVAALRERWAVLSPWDPNSQRLRPRPDAALILVDLSFRHGDLSAVRLRPLRQILTARLRGPISVRMSGNTVATGALNKTATDSAAVAEEIALPVLLIVLFLVFRSPVAAAIPAMVGFATVAAGAGVISLLLRFYSLTGLAVSIGAMMGLALGVDYSLLIVSRFREELDGGSDQDAAIHARTAMLTAGRTVLFAGWVLLVACALGLLITPGSILLSAVVGVMISVVLSLFSGAVAVPAMLAIVGPRIDRWRLGSGGIESARLRRVASIAMRRPLLVGGTVLAALLALCVPALAMHSQPPNLLQLPKGNAARHDYEVIQGLVGPGYIAPYVITVRSADGVITEPSMLARLAAFQRKLASDPEVATVIGPGPIASRARQLNQVGSVRAGWERAIAGVSELRAGLARAGSGLGALKEGALQFVSGASRIEAGSGQLSDNSRQLATGAALAASGATQLSSGLDAAARGTQTAETGASRELAGIEQLRTGAGNAANAAETMLLPGASRLAGGLRSGEAELGRLVRPAQIGTNQLSVAYGALSHMTVGRADPQYLTALRAVATGLAAVSGRNPITGQPVAAAYQGLVPALTQADRQLASAAAGAAGLVGGLHHLSAGLAALNRGALRLSSGARTLAAAERTLAGGLAAAAHKTSTSVAGLRRLANGAAQLASGAGQLQRGSQKLAGSTSLASGAGQLQVGLASGYSRSGPLQAGMQHAAGSLAGLTGLATPGGSGPAAQLTRGHLVLAAANSQPVARRDQSYFVVNAQRSGDTARLFVISRVFASTSRGYQLDRLLTDQTHRFLRDNGMTGGVGGVASQFADYHHAAGSFIPVLIASLSLVSLLLLITILRAVVLPLAAVLLNLAVVGASFGLLKLLFEGSHPVLGGPGFVDVVSLSGIFTILFSLSVDYEVFLLTRMREDYLVRRSPDGAVLYGVGRTASVVTGAALIMTAVFLAFGSSGFITLRQFGVGLAIAVLLDALLLRLVLLPAVMHLLGHWSWWLPRRLKRRLPSLTTQPDPRGPLAVLSDSLAAGPSAVAVAPGDSWRGRLTAEPVRNGGTSK